MSVFCVAVRSIPADAGSPGLVLASHLVLLVRFTDKNFFTFFLHYLVHIVKTILIISRWRLYSGLPGAGQLVRLEWMVVGLCGEIHDMKPLNLFRPGLAVAFLAFVETMAFANPSGSVVVAGSASIGGTASALVINQSSSRAVIDWNSFSIGAGESTSFHFYGPAGSASAVLNRVSAGAGPSVINGLLNSFVGGGNVVGGTVYVLNPNGLIIGSQGAINVGSFVGTTLSLNNRSFMQGGSALTLGGPNPALESTASVNNQGNINALGGDIFLVAQQVENSGSLSGNHVGLAAGARVQLTQPGLPGAERISILAGSPSALGGTGVDNSGAIKAVTAELQAAGGNVYALAINNSGTVRTAPLPARAATFT